MNVIDAIQVVLTVIVLWFVIVFLLYFVLIKVAGYKNAGLLARALYAVFLALLFLYSLFFSPYTRYMRVNSTGFYIALAVLALLLLFVVISGLSAGGRVKKGGGADA